MPHVQRRTAFDVEAAPGVAEAAVRRVLGPGLDDGSFEADVAPRSAGGSRIGVTARADMHVPYFQWFFAPVVARTLRRRRAWAQAAIGADLSGGPVPDPPKPPFLLGPGGFDQDQIRLVATASAIGALTEFGAALFGQNADSVAKAFHASNADLGGALAITRLGVLVALVASALADRRGRRRLLALSFAGVCIANAVTATAPSLAVFTGAQLLTRAFVQAVVVVAGIAVIEEAPENARAFAAMMFALASGAGFALSVVLLPIADLGRQAWRVSFAVSALTLLFLPALLRSLPETRRYKRLAARTSARGRLREVVDQRYRPRFVVLGIVAFLTSVFSAPSAQLTNRYLTDNRGFSNSRISLFRATTNGIPGLIGLVIGGRLAETRGRRPVAIVSMAIGAVVQMAFFLVSGGWLWVASTFAIVFAGGASIAIGTLDAEMFPTEVRATGNGLLLVCGVAGSIVGLLVAGNLADQLGGLGRAIALCGLAPLVAAIIVLPRLPESGHRRLDDVSPSEV